MWWDVMKWVWVRCEERSKIKVQKRGVAIWFDWVDPPRGHRKRASEAHGTRNCFQSHQHEDTRSYTKRYNLKLMIVMTFYQLLQQWEFDRPLSFPSWCRLFLPSPRLPAGDPTSGDMGIFVENVADTFPRGDVLTVSSAPLFCLYFLPTLSFFSLLISRFENRVGSGTIRRHRWSKWRGSQEQERICSCSCLIKTWSALCSVSSLVLLFVDLDAHWPVWMFIAGAQVMIRTYRTSNYFYS